MVQYLCIEDDLFKSKEDKMYKILAFASIIIN